jgi:hypothetical protein
MMKQLAVPITLKGWQDPQGNVALYYSREGCNVSFGCWEAAGEPAEYICKLSFHHAWAVRGENSEHLPYEILEQNRSCIYEVTDSEWLKHESEQRSKAYREWREWDSRLYHHYVVSGHDNYVEVLASGFEEQVVPRSEAGELAKLIDEA